MNLVRLLYPLSLTQSSHRLLQRSYADIRQRPQLYIALTKDTSAYRCYVPKSHGKPRRNILQVSYRQHMDLNFERAQAHKRGIFIVSFLDCKKAYLGRYIHR
jgi:hypothetical protein